MRCHVCHGAGWLVTVTRPRGVEWWPCPCCGGAGASVMYGPAEIGPGTRRNRG